MAILVYDIGNKVSFESTAKWVSEVKQQRGEEVLLAYLGNKSDLPGREVTEEEAKEKAEDYSALFGEGSAKTGDGLEVFFSQVVDKLIKTLPEDPNENLVPSNIQLNKV